MPSFTRESGGTLHVAVMGVNRIGKRGTRRYGSRSFSNTAMLAGRDYLAKKLFEIAGEPDANEI